jgi:hypothetical protein
MFARPIKPASSSSAGTAAWLFPRVRSGKFALVRPAPRAAVQPAWTEGVKRTLSDLYDLARGSLGRLGSGHIRTTTIGYIDDQPSPSRRRRFSLLAGLGAADDLTGRRDENWLTGTGAAITGTESDRPRADTVALACAFRIPAKGSAVAGFRCGLGWGGNGLFRC